MSMIKVTHSSDISATVGVGGEIVKSSSDLQKQASTIFRCEYDALKPPKGKTGIHLVALGDSEAYPMNRNGDLGLPVPNYVDENVSDKVVKIIQSYTGVVNKMVWRKY